MRDGGAFTILFANVFNEPRSSWVMRVSRSIFVGHRFLFVAPSQECIMHVCYWRWCVSVDLSIGRSMVSVSEQTIDSRSRHSMRLSSFLLFYFSCTDKLWVLLWKLENCVRWCVIGGRETPARCTHTNIARKWKMIVRGRQCCCWFLFRFLFW